MTIRIAPWLLAAGLFTQLPVSAEVSQLQLQQEFIQTQQQQGFSHEETLDFLSAATFNQEVLDAISRPWEAKPWYQYYPIFLTDKRLQAGIDFWQQHAAIIDKASKQFGVEPQIIVAIIGIETFYGQFMGKYPVRDALFTLGFYYPPRADFFRKEFGQLQQLVKEERLESAQLLGSYAGAMGFGQFIPSSYRHYAVDFDGDGQRDLLNNPSDAIGSVANYFHQHGWQMGADIALPLQQTEAQAIDVTPWAGERLTLSVADILTPPLALLHSQDLDVSQKAMLIALEQSQQTDYWLGLKNFYVITRYNRSPLYAMAVYQFSEQLNHAYQTR
ncbi:lytic murein transglycosylase B [Shewanella sp. NIFS-20-20]|uniref:lytic murein transglycosylase B n=1 Tax=Shewanella sp. NIFS-20-20 TaxID=2853806 RepID=UPI001C493F0C|nr:lytic murein transglycosylase B [Shewanella sp. NIFS-20-20]MBV7315873.1 lytic murein transglycosylase B [Shewanella sp. NIFS-20-20]